VTRGGRCDMVPLRIHEALEGTAFASKELLKGRVQSIGPSGADLVQQARDFAYTMQPGSAQFLDAKPLSGHQRREVVNEAWAISDFDRDVDHPWSVNLGFDTEGTVHLGQRLHQGALERAQRAPVQI
jgi:hypothetical protein